MASAAPMNRMLLGDVGTGKTLVAAHALAVAADSGEPGSDDGADRGARDAVRREGRAAARRERGVTWALLTGSTPAAERRRVLERRRAERCRSLFGTHALLEQSVSFAKLTLAIVDEQHRFGVSQRLGLRGKGAVGGPARDDGDADPALPRADPLRRPRHLLPARTAPRRGSEHVTTKLVQAVTSRRRLRARARQAVRAGRQAYVVCALVDESDAARRKSGDARGGAAAHAGLPRPAGRAAHRPHEVRREGRGDARLPRRARSTCSSSTTVIEVGRRRSQRHGHDRRGRRAVRSRAAAPAAGTRRARRARRASCCCSPIPRPPRAESAWPRSWPPTTASNSPSTTCGCAARGTSSATVSTACRSCGSPRCSPTATLIEQARARRDRARRGDPHLARPEHGPLAREVRRDVRGGLGVGEQRVRIVAGTFRGRRLAAPRRAPTRVRPPTGCARRSSARSRPGSARTSARATVLDAFAGQRRARPRGAVARSDARVTFVETRASGTAKPCGPTSPRSASPSTRTSCAGDAFSLPRDAVPGGPFALLLLDPPYRIACCRGRRR